MVSVGYWMPAYLRMVSSTSRSFSYHDDDRDLAREENSNLADGIQSIHQRLVEQTE